MIDIEEFINQIVGEDYEFWKSGGHDALYNAVTALLDLDVPPGVITYVLAEAWHAGTEEYGA